MTENRTYTEADLKALRKDWEQERTQSELTNAVSQMQGQLLTLPQTMEAIARRVVAEVIAEQHKQRGDRSWDRAPVVIQAVQFVLTVVLAVGAYLAGKGQLP